MKVLVIDDDRTPKFEAKVVRSSDEAIPLILYDYWDEVWFDFDLGGDDSAAEIIYAIEESAFWGRIPDIKKVIIHTSNPVGRKLLEQTLSKWYNIEHQDLNNFIIKDNI